MSGPRALKPASASRPIPALAQLSALLAAGGGVAAAVSTTLIDRACITEPSSAVASAVTALERDDGFASETNVRGEQMPVCAPGVIVDRPHPVPPPGGQIPSTPSTTPPQVPIEPLVPRPGQMPVMRPDPPPSTSHRGGARMPVRPHSQRHVNIVE